MDKPEEKNYNIEINIQGGRNCLSIGKGVIKALGSPSHVSFKISDAHDSISVFPCDEGDVMAFRVPVKLFLDHKSVMRINSKRFVQGIMQTNGLDTTRTYRLKGEYLQSKNIAVFPFEGAILRAYNGNDQTT